MTETTSVVTWGQGLTTKRYKKTSRVLGIFYILIAVLVIYTCQYSLNCTLQMDSLLYVT